MSEIIDFEMTLGDFVAQHPRTRKVFDKFSLDYCCGGKQDIKTAAGDKKIDLDELRTALEASLKETKDEKEEKEKVWISESLTNIVDYILARYHAFMWKELSTIDQLMAKIVLVHARRHGEFLNSLSNIYSDLKDDLEKHLRDEETLLFPFIKQLDQAMENEIQPEEFSKFIKILRTLYKEHDDAGAALSDIRNLTSNYVLPDDVCLSFEALYEHLQAIEDNLHEHIHLENTILFPRVEKLVD